MAALVAAAEHCGAPGLVRRNVPHRDAGRKFFCRHGGFALNGDSQLPHPMSH